MTRKINIGPGTDIDVDDFLESRALIQSNSGGGKSGIVRVIIEESFGMVPFILIDKTGEYYPLKEKFGDIIVIGGMNADIPLSMQAASLLPKIIISNGLSVIIDLGGVDMDNDKRALYIRDFLKSLMNLTQQYWKDYLIFIEEAHLWCGQQDKLPCGKYVKELMSEGRKMGYCGVLITQRISKLHKDAAAEANNKFVGRTFLDIDMDRSASELGLKGQDKYKLRDLKRQHFYAFGTSIDPQHVHEVIIKDAKTRFIKKGANLSIAPKKPTAKLLAALAKLSELPKAAAKEIQDLKTLQIEVKRLQGELNKKTKEKDITAPSKEQEKQIAVITDQLNKTKAYVFELQNEIQVLQGREKKLMDTLTSAAKAAASTQSLGRNIGELIATTIRDLPAKPVKNKNSAVVGLPMLRRSDPFPQHTQRIKEIMEVKRDPSSGTKTGTIRTDHAGHKHATYSPGEKLPKGELRVLSALAQYEGGLSRRQLTTITGYTVRTRNQYIFNLSAKGLIHDRGEKFIASKIGLDTLGDDFQRLPRGGHELQQFWLRELPLGEKRVLEVLLEAEGQPVSREDISERTGYTIRTRNQYIFNLIAKEIAETSGKSEIKAVDFLFESAEVLTQ